MDKVIKNSIIYKFILWLNVKYEQSILHLIFHKIVFFFKKNSNTSIVAKFICKPLLKENHKNHSEFMKGLEYITSQINRWISSFIKLFQNAVIHSGVYKIFFYDEKQSKKRKWTSIICFIFNKPEIGLYIVAFLIPFYFVSFMQITLILFFTLFIYFLKSFWNGEKIIRTTPIYLPLLAFLFLWIGTTVTSISPRNSIKSLQIHGIAVLLYFLFVCIIKTKRQMYYLLCSIFSSSLVVSLYGIFQYFFVGQTSDSWIDAVNNPEITTRAFSTLENPNNLANYLILILPLSIGMIFLQRKGRYKLLFSMNFIFMLICLFLTSSRGAWLGFAVAIFLFILVTNKRIILLLTPFLPIAFIALPSKIINRVITILQSAMEFLNKTQNITDSSINYRVNIWNAAIKMIQDYWWGGIGFGSETFRTVYPLYKEWAHIAWHAHNLYLEILVEMGILGLIVFLWLMFTYLKCGFIKYAKGKDPFIKHILLGCCTGVIASLIYGTAEYVWFYPKVLLTFWMVIGITMAAINIEKYDVIKKELHN